MSSSAFVAARIEGTSLCAQIREIVKPKVPWKKHGVDDPDTPIFISVQIFDFDSTKHDILDMPTISRQERHAVLKPADIICATNVQHDCSRGRCMLDKPKHLYQEREKTSHQRMIVSHSDDLFYILNTQSLHNYQIRSSLIPHHLRGSRYLVVDEAQLRRDAAAGIRSRSKDQTEAKEDLLITEIAGHVETDGNINHSSGSSLLQSLQDDSELVDIIQGVLQRSVTATLEDMQRLPSLQNDDSNEHAEPNTSNTATTPPIEILQNRPSEPLTLPVFSTVSKLKAQSKRKPSVAPENLYVCALL